MSVSPSERQRASRARRAANGLVPFTVYAPKGRKLELYAFAQALAEVDINGLVVRSRKTGRVSTVTLDQFATPEFRDRAS